MSKTEPIRDLSDIQKMKEYLLNQKRWRDYALITLGLNTALRISDLLTLQWKDVYNFSSKSFYRHVYLTEQKTQKKNTISLNDSILEALELLKNNLVNISDSDYIIKSRISPNRPIHRSRAYAIIRELAKENGIEGHISCHSLRKTFGYQAWKNGYSPAVIMEIYNHSSLQVTRRYLSINQDDKDQIFMNLML